MGQRLQKIHIITSLSAGFFIFTVGILSAFSQAEAEISRHEIFTEIRWNSVEYDYDNYITNGEPAPGVSGHRDTEYLLVTSSYSFFFTPVTEEEEIPIPLRRFYAHPTTIRVHLSMQPEAENTYIHQNQGIHYRSSTVRDTRSRSAGLDVEYYPWNDTGILFSLSSKKNEEEVRTSNTLADRGAGENNEIRRYYGLGISQYLFSHLNLRLTYTTFNFEYAGIKKTWEENNPLLFRESGQEADTDGRKILLTGEYILRKFLGIQGFYEFWDQEGHSDVLSSYYDNFPGSEYFYDADTTNQTLGTSLSVYLRHTTMLRFAGSIARQENDLVYETDQIVEHDWDITTIETEISHYINRYIGLRAGYEFARREGDVVIRHPESENDPRTEYQVDSDVHEVYVGVTGRF